MPEISDFSSIRTSLKPQADSVWIEDYFVSYVHGIISTLNEYYMAVEKNRCGLSRHKISLTRWFAVRTDANSDAYCNSGEMLSILIQSTTCKRCLKLDISSFSDLLTSTAYTVLCLDSKAQVINSGSVVAFQGRGQLISFNLPKLLARLYDFLEFGIDDIESSRVLVSIH